MSPLQAFFDLAPDERPRLYLHHTPPVGVPLRGAVLYVPPWAEEMNKSRRMAALASGRLAGDGWSVLQIDLLGCGDSGGDFSDATWVAWTDDVVRAAQWLQALHPDLPLWLWGLRAGALLAAAALPRLPGATQLLLWQPVVQGKVYLQQFLRLKAAAQLAGGGKAVLAAARAGLAAGHAVEVAGYGLGPALAAGLETAVLAPPPGAAPQGPSAPRRLIWLEASNQPTDTPGPAAQAALAAWQATGWQTTWQAVQGPAFWQTTEIEDAPALINATAAAMAAAAPASEAAPAAGFEEPTVVQTERPVLFGCEGERLLGILHQAEGDTGCVVIVGGPQYRVGSHRQFVHLARALAAARHPVLRFDVRGMGDSSGRLQQFEQIAPDIGAAIDALQAHCPNVRRVMLWGLCDGASAALLYLHDRKDKRVQALALANPWVRAPLTQARMQVRHYYWQRLRQREFWKKLLGGGIGVDALRDYGRALATSSRRAHVAAVAHTYQARMLAGWRNASVQTLLLLSKDDYTAREFAELAALDPSWRAATASSLVLRQVLDDADHTFSTQVQRALVARLTREWLVSAAAAARWQTVDGLPHAQLDAERLYERGDCK